MRRLTRAEGDRVCECGHTRWEHPEGGSCAHGDEPGLIERGTHLCLCLTFRPMEESSMDPVDLQAERAASRTRQEPRRTQEMLRHRARFVLNGRWNASRTELHAGIAEAYPKLERDAQDELLAVVLEVQRTERPRIDPATVRCATPEPEPEAVYHAPAPESTMQEVPEELVPTEDPFGISAVDKQSATPAPTPETEAAVQTLETKPYNREQDRSMVVFSIMTFLGQRDGEGKATPAEARDHIRKVHAIELSAQEASNLLRDARTKLSTAPRRKPGPKPRAKQDRPAAAEASTPAQPTEDPPAEAETAEAVTPAVEAPAAIASVPASASGEPEKECAVDELGLSLVDGGRCRLSVSFTFRSWTLAAQMMSLLAHEASRLEHSRS